MARFIIVDPSETEPFAEFLGKLENPQVILKQVGALMVSASQRAFGDQKFGSFKWPPRYPNQADPVVNVAGVVADLNLGSPIKARRFQRRKALIDTGALEASIASRVVGKNKVEVGSPLERAATHQHGLVSVQPVTQKAKKGLAKFLLDRAKTENPRRDPVTQKLKFLLNPNVNSLSTQVAQRPFLGITDELEGDIVQLVEESFA